MTFFSDSFARFTDNVPKKLNYLLSASEEIYMTWIFTTLFSVLYTFATGDYLLSNSQYLLGKDKVEFISLLFIFSICTIVLWGIMYYPYFLKEKYYTIRYLHNFFFQKYTPCKLRTWPCPHSQLLCCNRLFCYLKFC